MVIPEEYIIQKFYQHAGYPKYTKSTNTYTGGCPVCREGKSWGRKSRCYYIPNDNVICCHNCGWYSSTTNWIMEVESITYKEMMQQIDRCDYEYGIPKEQETVAKKLSEDLPRDSINIFDKTQLSYYKNHSVVRKAIVTIVDRRLNKATNKPKSLYVSLNDYTHKNRLIIPFYDNTGRCTFYQSRKLLDDNTPKYLSKVNSEKSLFNYDNIKSSADNIFITEGPIDSFFIENSVAVAGIQDNSRQSFTSLQRQQIDRLFLMQSVWVLDSQWLDETSKNKTRKLLDSNQCVFLWPKDVGTKFKDVNDMCVHFNVNHLSHDYIMKNTYCGAKGILKLNQIR